MFLNIITQIPKPCWNRNYPVLTYFLDTEFISHTSGVVWIQHCFEMAYLKSVQPNFLLNIFCLQKVPLKLHKLYLVFILHALFCQLTLNELHSLEFMPIRLGLHTSTYSLCLSTQSTSIFMVPRSDFALIHF